MTREDELERRLSAVAFGERRALLEQLLHQHLDGNDGTTITALAAATGTNRFTASRHLSVLRDAGLVRADAAGTRRLHRIDLDAMWSLDEWLYPFIDAAGRDALEADTSVGQRA
ncbi:MULTISPECIES: helix-turn-helix domain-containing protein [unclassified Microbacterium]|uniref:ArsR/SmtB family transcription factor n=1 Tax=unclassified Microbacterium TaxID=2609290 RepID=UPI00214B43D0|nr:MULTISPECIES: helix-turn-helix domain-containing protein [unclassified Microbacterium]MCR2810949.1 helix-turn-helix domain-containing protein [Microbacterium sp. zg.B185]WIM19652.1 helix-turn-helix domain-containing protein [Microbacterium sp. zg-B185]